jgi:hypothetical protein
MKRIRLAILFIPLLVMGGCVSLDAAGCRAVEARLIARDHGKIGNGRRSSFINVNPDTVELEMNCPFVLKNPGGHEIHTTSTTAWLNRSTPTTGDITMGNAKGKSGDVFKYTVHVKDIGQLDPRGRLR